MFGRISPSCYDERLAPDRFTLREVVAHLADLEPVIKWRMELALSSPGAEIPNWDQDAEALAKNYSTWEVPATLELFANERAKTVELFESLSDEETRMPLQHPILGVISIFDIASFTLGHDCYHFEQVSHYL